MSIAPACPHIPPFPEASRRRRAVVPLLREVSAIGLLGLLGAWGFAEVALLLSGV
jgi:hypothetical protein